MKVIVNGEAHEVPAGATVASVVAGLSAAPSGVAVALNDEVVRRGAWADTPIREADRLEVLTAVQGG
jgi:sulfur carrier protein